MPVVPGAMWWNEEEEEAQRTSGNSKIGSGRTTDGGGFVVAAAAAVVNLVGVVVVLLLVAGLLVFRGWNVLTDAGPRLFAGRTAGEDAVPVTATTAEDAAVAVECAVVDTEDVVDMMHRSNQSIGARLFQYLGRTHRVL